MCKKVCTNCKEEKSLENFGVNKKSKDGLNCRCKECIIILSKEYREKYPERKKESSKKYILRNKEKIKQKAQLNKDKIKEYKKNYFQKNKKIILEKKQKWRKENPEKYKEENRIRHQKQKHIKRKRTEYNRNYSKKRMKEDEIFNLRTKVRGRLKSFLKIRNITKRNQTFSIVGCTPEELRIHLEKQFKEGMTWELFKQSKIHIDHRTPLSSAKTEEEIYKLCHYTNLQPLWAEENMKKGSKIINQNE